jgi:hypothetical protein
MNELCPGVVLPSLGEVVRARVLAPSVYWVTTVEHGGYVLHKDVVRHRLSQAAITRGVVDGEWVCFEEDCAWAMVVHECPEWVVEPLDVLSVEGVLQQEYPDYLEEVAGEECSAQERHLRQTTFRVMGECCANCLFGPRKIVEDERKEELLQDIVRRGVFFVCHEGSERGQKICCRAFYERYKGEVASLQMAQILEYMYPGSLQFVLPMEEEEEGR